MRVEVLPQRVPPERSKARFSMASAQNSLKPAESVPRTTKTPNGRGAPPTRPKTFSDRITKIKKHREGSIKASLTQKLTEQFEKHRDRLYDTARDELDASEARQKAAIDKLEAQFNEKLKLLTEQDAKITLDLAKETVQILAPDTGTPEGKGKAKREEYVNVLLGDRGKEFEGFIDEKRLELRDLYNEWNVTQGKIIALAIKILGPTNVVLDPKHYAGYSELSGIVKKASTEYKKTVEGLHEEGRKIGEIENSLNDVTKKTSNEINAIHQDFKKERKRRSDMAEKVRQYQADLE